MSDYIEIKGARVNNLKNIDVKIPRDKLCVIAGVSGSGKSSLAFDTLYAEGQRRYVESLSSYARQFLGRMSKPECDYFRGIPPSIAIEQKVISRNPRSTVGTTTEIYEYLRLLFARIGHTYSPVSNTEVKKHSMEDVISSVLQYDKGTRFLVTTPMRVPEGRTTRKQIEMYMLQGYSRVLYHGEMVNIDDMIANGSADQCEAKDVNLIIDRMSVDDSKDVISRLTDSVETAYYEGDGICQIFFLPSYIMLEFSQHFEADGIKFEEPTDSMFAFNSPLGACPRCEGFGNIIGIDEKLVIPHTDKSVYEGCVQCWKGEKMGVWLQEFMRRAKNFNFPIFTPYYQLEQKYKDWLWHGLPDEHLRPQEERVSIDDFFEMVRQNQYKIQYRVMQSRYRGKTVCPECKGTRLKKEVTYVRIGGMDITQLVEMPINSLSLWFDNLTLSEHEQQIAKRLLAEIKSRLHFICEVGLGYLTLNRPSNTLSGGESQRINLTTSLGSSLVGSLYILDEPSIGLHSRDTDRLIKVLKQLRDIGNTVVVVEHDEEIMRAANYIIDIGPDAGRLGGKIVFEGKASDVLTSNREIVEGVLQHYPDSYTVKYLTGTEKIDAPKSYRPWNRKITLRGARMNNLCGIDVDFPLNVMTVVTGVSGSGKSSLIKGILYPALKRSLDEVAEIPGEYQTLEGDLDAIKHVEFVDQNPIGKSTRSNPATYIKAYDEIRSIFADQALSHQMGFTPQHFSFNTEGGRCEECKGAGEITVEMQFMADITLQCEHCHGRRFKQDVLDVLYHGKSIYDVLCMTINEAIEFFTAHGNKLVVQRLKPLQDVGLGYIKMGQNSSTLSGGENQRVKLAYYMSQEKATPTLFIFDEPTTGLHFHDISRLLKAFNALIERGHSILIIEHNMDIIKCADYVIDMGPEGGNRGGRVVCTGTPKEISLCKDSITGQFLKDKLL